MRLKPTLLLLLLLVLFLGGCNSRPRDIDGLLSQAEELFDAQRYAAAIERLDDVLRRDSRHLMAHVRRAQCLAELGRLPDAQSAYQLATELEPADAGDYMLRAIAWKNLGQEDRAIADYDEAIARQPDLAPAYLLRGMFHRKQGIWDRAIADLNDALRLGVADSAKACHEGLAQAYYNRGMVRSGVDKRYLEALEDFGNAFKHDPTMFEAIHERALCYQELKDYPRALAELAELIRRDPKPAIAYHTRAEIWMRHQEWDQAIIDLQEATKLDPTLFFVHERLAKAYESAGEPKKAAEALKTAMKVAKDWQAGPVESWYAESQQRIEQWEREELERRQSSSRSRPTGTPASRTGDEGQAAE